MTSAFSWQNFFLPLPCFILFSKAKFVCYSRYFLTFYFCIPVPYNEKDIFFGCYFQKVLQIFIEPFNFIFFSIIGRGIDLDYCNILILFHAFPGRQLSTEFGKQILTCQALLLGALDRSLPLLRPLASYLTFGSESSTIGWVQQQQLLYKINGRI